MGHLQRFHNLIFADRRFSIENVCLGHLFHFRGLPVNRKIWIPQIFSAVQQLLLLTLSAPNTYTNPPANVWHGCRLPICTHFGGWWIIKGVHRWERLGGELPIAATMYYAPTHHLLPPSFIRCRRCCDAWTRLCLLGLSPIAGLSALITTCCFRLGILPLLGCCNIQCTLLRGP